MLPADYDTVTVRGGYVHLNGKPAAGRVLFTGKVIAASASTQTLIVPATITAELDDGRFEVELPATDDPDILPNGWTYRVEEKLNAGGGRVFNLDVPLAAKPTGIELATVAPAAPSQGHPTVFVTLSSLHALLEDLEARVGDGGAAWADVTGKPATFPPATHGHSTGDIAGLSPGPWTGLTLMAATATGDPFEAPGARIEFPDIVRLRGCVTVPATTSVNTPLFAVPAGMAPLTKVKRFSVRTFGSSVSTLLAIYPDGTASLVQGSGPTEGQLTLDDISYPR